MVFLHPKFKCENCETLRLYLKVIKLTKSTMAALHIVKVFFKSLNALLMFIMMKKAFTTKFQIKNNHLILLKYHKKSTQFVPSLEKERKKLEKFLRYFHTKLLLLSLCIFMLLFYFFVYFFHKHNFSFLCFLVKYLKHKVLVFIFGGIFFLYFDDYVAMLSFIAFFPDARETFK